MFDHQDTLEELNKNLPLGQKLSSVHGVIQKQFDFVDRVGRFGMFSEQDSFE